ncbi:hypothetical protein GCM10027187_08570 [Streptosporangium sandarakinum]|uniref:Regulator of replication initiation timing n=1 Tax=Streptosporangium sandarakinum TaxID=1260955 RepID=A0A852V1Z4_9ACTN|nr:hypothetical protein [Streptosporangium sandarakinum]NYF42160.1 regulator of replication initiation timing [Streptosporangium sandarakinum]
MTSGRYRTVFHTALPPADAFGTAARELRSWLVAKSRHKAIDIAAYDDGQARLGEGIILLRNSRSDGGGAQTHQWQLREHDAGGYWLSSLVVHAPSKPRDPEQRTWFWLDVEYIRTTDETAKEERRPPRAAVPGIARQLLAAVEARDHWAELTPKPILIRPDRVEELLDILVDEERRLPVVVASPHSRVPFESWRVRVEGLTKLLPGLASLYILDPLAETQFNNAVGAPFGVRGGAIRTYLPGLDPAVDGDATRHRVLSEPRIEVDNWRAAQLLTGLPRKLAADGRLPGPLTRLARTAAAVTSVPPRPTLPPQTDAEASLAALRQEIASLRQENGELRRENDELRQLFDMAGHEETKLREELAVAQDDLLDVTDDLEASNKENAELKAWVRVLRRRLEEAGRAAEAYVPVEEPVRLPTQLPEVVEWLKDLDRVEFTGDIDKVWKLEEKAQSSTWAQTAWKVVLAFQEYAESVIEGRFKGGDFRRWCSEPPSGVSAISAGKVKPDESESVRTNTRMRRQREFPVPPEVHHSGRVHMWSHIYIGGNAGMSSPRLHFHDDVHGTGKIYIGYLGPHLEVKSTN